MSKGVSWQMAVFPPNVPSWARIWQVTTRGSPTSRLLGPLTPIPALPMEACLSVTVGSHTEIRSHRVSSLGRLCPSPAGWRKPGRWDPNSTSNTAGSPWGWSPGPHAHRWIQWTPVWVEGAEPQLVCPSWRPPPTQGRWPSHLSPARLQSFPCAAVLWLALGTNRTDAQEGVNLTPRAVSIKQK